MEKNWKSAPWVVRLLFIFWIAPLLLTGLSVGFLVVIMAKTDPIGIWRIPVDIFRFQYDAMPVSTSIDIGISIMYCSAAFYAWKMLGGNGNSRMVLEMFSWISIVFTATNLFFPSVRYLEMGNLSPSFWDTPISFLLLAAFMLLLQVAALYYLRTTKVKSYANAF